MRRSSKRKSGREFEDLIAWIQSCVHNRAKIDINKKVRDVDTGKLRQIDIGIHLSDGPTEFFGIIEVRDRSRSIGVRYVEEISAKRQSVRADAAFLVSRSGFTKTAITKASRLGIRALTYDEAKDADWSDWLQCRTIRVLSKKYENVSIAFAEFGSTNLMTILSEVIQDFEQDETTKIIKTKDGSPHVSLPDLVRVIINLLAEELYKDIEKDESRQKRTIIIDELQYEPPLFIENGDGKLCRIGKTKVEVDCYYEFMEYPFKLMKYRNINSLESIVEVATADVMHENNKYRIELAAPGAGKYIPAGTEVSIKITNLEKNNTV